MEKIILFGAGKIAEVAYNYLKEDSAFDVVAFTVDKEYIKENEFLGIPLVPFEEVENVYPPGQFKMFVMIGYHNLNKIRAEKCDQAKEKGYKLVSYISSKAQVAANVTIGENCFITEFNSIQPCCEIGDDVVMWPNNHLSHHSKIKDHNWITAGVIIAGCTTIGSFCFIGVNATIGNEIFIGDETLIGAGANITKSGEPKSVFITGNTEKFKLDSSMFLRFTKLHL